MTAWRWTLAAQSRGGFARRPSVRFMRPMAFSEALAERIRQRLARRRNVEEKRCSAALGSCSAATGSSESGRIPSSCASARKGETRR